jgi:hypothetical protein
VVVWIFILLISVSCQGAIIARSITTS